MSRVIWKFQLFLAPGGQSIPMPTGTDILSCGVQGNDNVVMWGACDPTQPVTSRLFHVRMTGQDAPENARFIGTCLVEGGAYVLHVFESEPDRVG